MKTGQLKWYNSDKHFGFIIAEDLDRDVFFHENGISQDCDLETLVEGAIVEFNFDRVKKGYEGRDINVVNGSGKRITESDLFRRRIERFEIDESKKPDPDGLFISAIILEGGVRLPLVIDDNEPDEAIFLSFNSNEDIE